MYCYLKKSKLSIYDQNWILKNCAISECKKTIKIHAEHNHILKTMKKA